MCADLRTIGGCTIHSWAGIGLGRGSQEELLTRIRRSKVCKLRWQSTQILVVDESALDYT